MDSCWRWTILTSNIFFFLQSNRIGHICVEYYSANCVPLSLCFYGVLKWLCFITGQHSWSLKKGLPTFFCPYSQFLNFSLMFLFYLDFFLLHFLKGPYSARTRLFAKLCKIEFLLLIFLLDNNRGLWWQDFFIQ